MTTKKIGITNPKPIPSSRIRKSSASSLFVISPTIRPAANAPSTMSNPNSLASSTSAKRTTSATRTANWPLVVIVRRAVATKSRRARAQREQRRERGDEQEDEQERERDAGLPAAVSTSAVTISGQNSPATPAARTNGPSGVSSSPASRSTGISVPIAVVESATPTSTAESTKPTACSSIAAPSAIAIDSSQPAAASRAGAPRMRSKSISIPPTKKRNASPTSLRNSTAPSGFAKPSSCGPTRIPSAISATTAGARRRFGRSTISGASAAATRTISSEPSSWSTCASLPLGGGSAGIVRSG